MSEKIEDEIVINASPARVWAVLTNFEAYREWNPFIRNVEGEPKQDALIRLTVIPPNGKPMVFNPRVTRIEENVRLVFLDRFLMDGLFDSKRIFEIEPLDEGRVKFRQVEHVSGLLSKLILKLVRNVTEMGFKAMNVALKARVEG